MATTRMVRRLAFALAACTAAAVLAACAAGAVPQEAGVGAPAASAEPPTPTPVSSPTPASAPAPGRKPPQLLRFAGEPADAVFRAGETVRLTVVISNAESAPLTVADLPPAVTLTRPNGERVRTLPGGAGSVTLPPDGAYRHPVEWDGRRDDGSPAPPGRYGIALSPVLVENPPGRTQITAGAGGFVLQPAGGVRLGDLRPGLSATSDGYTMTLQGLAMGERESGFVARIEPALPNRGSPGGPPGDRRFRATYSLDGGPPESVLISSLGGDDPAGTTVTWTLDPLPANAQLLDLSVDLSGDARGRWAFRVPLAAPSAAGPSGTAAGASTPSALGPRPEPPGIEWRDAAAPTATDQGFQVVRLGTLVQVLGGAYGAGYVAAYIAFVAPAGDQGIPAPPAGQLRSLDSLGQRHAVEYAEIVRHPGVTVGVAVLRGPLVGRRTLSLELDALEVVRGQSAPTPVRGRWTVGLVEQLADAPRPTMIGGPSERVVEANGTRIHFATSGLGGPVGQPAAFGIRRAGTAPPPAYALLATDTGAVRPLNRAAGDCYFARLYAPTPAPATTPTPRPGPPATSTPAGVECVRLAAETPTPPNTPAATAAQPAGTPWPLLGAPPTPCPAYTYPTGPLRAWPTVDPTNPATLRAFDPCAVRSPKNPDALRPSGGPYISQQEVERRALDGKSASKIRSYLVTYASASRLLGGDGASPEVYPDREVWLVVIAQDPFQCARPSLRPGVPEWPRRWCHGYYDATTGQSYGGGGNGPGQGDWPPSLPPD